MADHCMSGGCRGADVLFGEMAEKHGHAVSHFSFGGHKHYSKRDQRVVLNALELMEADPWLKLAGTLLKRPFPTAAVYTDNLLRRNYRQVRDSERVYATTWFARDGRPMGGTGWTVTMAILLKVPEIYVHDKKSDYWKVWEPKMKFEWDSWKTISRPDKPHGIYAGIGSHDLEQDQDYAIRSLYD